MKNNLQQLRWEKDWSQARLALISNVSRVTIYNIENNVHTPSVYTALLLAKALSCTVDDIFSL